VTGSDAPDRGSSDRPVRAYVGLGSNLREPVRQVQRGLEALTRLPNTRRVRRSALYRSQPLGVVTQPDFVNAVAALETELSPFSLLCYLQHIERQQGRVRDSVRWGPRTLDLDLLLFGEVRLHSPDLTLPHPGLHRRSFVLYPLHEIAPHLVIPGRGAVVELLRKVSRGALEVLDA
jgi:2-amino-4-hydroxy-6-hydroxymethyldihydropteridine diphosphokinase